MSADKIIVGDYGQVFKITFIDTDTNAAADISAYTTTKQMIFTDPGGNDTTVTAAFDSTGTDGIIKYTIVSGLFDEAGDWHVRGRVISTGSAILSTVKASFRVES